MRLFDPAHPFFRPAWRRYLTVVFPFLWAFVEFSLGNVVWAYLFAAIGGYCAWFLILTWKDPDDGSD
ncbi:MAG: hypothetical protein AAGK37_06895 [Pseudomonadota bacterium]